jgi:hypothetical protein
MKKISASLTYKRKVRKWYEGYKTTLKCARCGLSGAEQPERLHFHHRNGSDKEDNVGRMIGRGYSIEHIKREIAKCEVLCDGCHAKEHGLSDPHDLQNENLR